MQLGETFVMGEDGHLWVIISDPTMHNNESIMVNITSNVFRAGRECELNPGDHPFVTGKSYISFGDARKITPDAETKMKKCIASGLIRPHAPMKKATLDRIVAAAKLSKALRKGYRAYL
jgi:hypothetical protein